MTKLKILQVNVNRSLGAQDIARALGNKLSCSFVCLQEPNKKSVSSRSANLYVSDGPDKNAVIFKNKNAVIPILTYNSHNSFIFIQCSSICLYSVYISPNCVRDTYVAQVNEIFAHTRMTMAATKLPVVVCGDFNAKNKLWGGEVTDWKGEYLLTAATALGMVTLNDGVHPTLVRANGQSFIDLTLVSQELTGSSWQVLHAEESLSDHQPILVQIELGRRIKLNKTTNRADPKVFIESIDIIRQEHWSSNVDRTVKKIVAAHRSSKKPIKIDSSGTLPYWWSDDVANQISQTRTARRRYQRENRQANRELLYEEYVNTRRTLTNLIRKNKREKWKNLCQALNEDIYGDAYNIVRAQLKCRGPSVTLTSTERRKIFEELFTTVPQGNTHTENSTTECPEVTETELMYAVSRIKAGTAPGPDGISPEHARTAIMEHKDLFRNIYSNCLQQGHFPRAWKLSRLVLIEKPTAANVKKYRPICLLDVLGKVLETLINERLKAEIDLSGGLNNNQFGFRHGKSTIDAIEKIVGIVKNDKTKITTAIFIDVKNAFNTADWNLIIRKVERRKINPGLVKILTSYLTQRSIMLEPNSVEGVYAGVPQGSVLGPTLWNLLYDDVMCSCDHIGIELVCYADDLAVVIQADNVEDTIDKGNRALESIKRWMEVNKLQMAPEKTTSVVFSWSSRHRKDIKFVIGNHEIIPRKQTKYLGVTLDFSLSFTKHVDDLSEKAAKIIKTLNILLTNTNGPIISKRRVLAGALQSALTYAAPVWADALQFQRCVKKLKMHQRAIALRCCCGYSTVSADAAALVAGMVPIDLLILERKRVRDKMTQNPEASSRVVKEEERLTTMGLWQNQWDQNLDNTAAWTRLLIRDVQRWINRSHGDVDYHLSQALTGHGCFQSYLYKIKKVSTPECVCRAGVDDAGHTLFECPRFRESRLHMRSLVGERIERNNMVEIMLKSKQNWQHIHSFIKEVLIQKEAEEREIERKGDRR